MPDKKIALGSDHGGFRLKEEIKNYLESKGFEAIDFGTESESSVDYPDFAFKVVKAIINGDVEKGIIMCGTGIGISITANRFPGIRAALCWDSFTAKMSRLHNNSNLLAMGGRIIGVELAKDIVDTWLSTEFEGGRHERRINKIDELAKIFWEEYLRGDK
ncbi:ribose 5-phosphate isomerase B [Deferribacter desulfuricans SSM1]|uniref:Ribose 5-phosphate isomerase B n=1 Tax=Deferribacter desulfuricans (strain DSM 14783 / JCM 11476 / NBRC 101012 / SSM1) TaxID=639282 RepID=D3PBK5_DEFDS|nr:ribose 5-phosphate isomerase B [Deferribacter desulfuricans]BAI79978.1 ribose 5-phosphate isomerase B [Deferribacter desulfuricans SSM1]